MSWDGSDDDWDVDSDEDISAKLGLAPQSTAFDDEEDLAIIEKREREKNQTKVLKTKGVALAKKREEEQARKEELELAKKAMELDIERENNMTEEERREALRKKLEEDDNGLVDDMFGDTVKPLIKAPVVAMSDKLVLKDLKQHLRHAKKVGKCVQDHGKVYLASAFLKECIQEFKEVLDDEAISGIIKTCNVIKNEKVQSAKRKVKGQAQKSKKDKAAEIKAKKISLDTFGESNTYDDYDEFGDQYEDDFF